MKNHAQQMIEIPLKDIDYISDSFADDVGCVFTWQGRFLRGIRNAHVAEIEALLTCGLMQKLFTDGLFPYTRKTNYQLDGYGLVLEHETVPVVTYPYEWSFTMFKDAAIVMLRVNQIARAYGYQTKDAHGYNVLFHGAKPVFIDLGSFVKIVPGDVGWQGYEEFLSFFYYPLKMWCEGNEFLARRTLSGGMLPLMAHENYLAYRHPLLRRSNDFSRRRLSRLPLLLKRLSNIQREDVKQNWPSRKGVLLYWLRPFTKLFRWRSDLSDLMKKVQRLQLKESKSKWGAYHMQSGVFSESGEIRPSLRFKRLAELIDQFDIKNVVELAGNQGAFARYLLTSTQVETVTCTDYDTNVIDRLYRSLDLNKKNITPAVLNFVSPTLLAETKPAHQRMQAEAVVALAVSHHLLLTQRISIDKILGAVCQYTSQYVFVEFMPLGLYDGQSEPTVPNWYTLNWFREACLRYFQIVNEEQLEENRIIFIGHLR